MNLDKKQYLKYFGQIQTCNNYLKIESKKNLKKRNKLVFNKYFIEDEEYCVVEQEVKDGYLCFYEDENSDYIHYFHLVLDSMIGRFMLDSNSPLNGFKGQVTLKRLREFPIIIPPKEVLQAGKSLDLAINTIMNLADKKDDKLFLEATKSLMTELRDDFVMEIYTKDLFVSNNISIVDSLLEILKDCNEESLAALALHIMSAITDLEGNLLSNMRRFRVLLSKFNNKSSL